MTETLPRLDEPGDAELISAVRGGDVSAYGALFERHVGSARRLARQLVGGADADDLVSDAFAKVLRVLQGGGGPDIAFRAYLLTAVRRLHVDKIRSNSKLHTTDDLEQFDPGVPFRDTAVEGFESAAAAKAFASLPERWQAVLWHTEVEGQKPAEVALLLGMTANSVSALAYRAREGLRQAFLNSHISELDDDECRWTHEHIGAYIRDGVSKRDAAKVEKHIDECRRCMAIYLELTEVNSNLAGILAPLLLGAAGAGYLASAGGFAAKGGLLLLLDRSKELIAANSQAAAVAGVAAATVVVGGTVIAVTGDDPRPAAEPPPIVAPATSDETSKPAKGKKNPAKQPAKRPVQQPVPSPITEAPVPGRSALPSSPAAEPTTTSEPTTETTTTEPTTTEPTSTAPPSTPPATTSTPPTTSEPPTTSTPPTTSEPPTTSTPPTTAAPVYNLGLQLEADTNGLGTVEITATARPGAVPDEWTATIIVTWGLLSLAQPPQGCVPAGRPNTATCDVTPENNSVFLRARQVPGSHIRFELTNFSFLDSDASDNSQTWTQPLLGLPLPLPLPIL